MNLKLHIFPSILSHQCQTNHVFKQKMHEFIFNDVNTTLMSSLCCGLFYFYTRLYHRLVLHSLHSITRTFSFYHQFSILISLHFLFKLSEMKSKLIMWYDDIVLRCLTVKFIMTVLLHLPPSVFCLCLNTSFEIISVCTFLSMSLMGKCVILYKDDDSEMSTQAKNMLAFFWKFILIYQGEIKRWGKKLTENFFLLIWRWWIQGFWMGF